MNAGGRRLAFVGTMGLLGGSFLPLESAVLISGIRIHHHGESVLLPKLAVPFCPRKAVEAFLTYGVKSSPRRPWPSLQKKQVSQLGIWNPAVHRGVSKSGPTALLLESLNQAAGLVGSG